MSTEHEDFSDSKPLTANTQSPGSKRFEDLNDQEQADIMESINSDHGISDEHYRVRNIKYGEKTVTGRVIGRNKTVIPEEEVAQLSQYHCTNKEMADFYNVPLQTFMDNFRDIIDKNRIITKQRLRKTQLDLALKGDKTMLIWLGRNILGQTENPVNTESSQVLPWLDEDNK
jgi:hypothetical protein